jgi:DNA-binding LacI/PurR family transcriptional regulator
MNPNPSLFDHVLDRSPRGGTLAEQAYTALRAEIDAGRWAEGDRLPSIQALTEMTGLSRTPFQWAYERLRSEGFIRHNGRAGTRLVSPKPIKATDRGTIGIALLREHGVEYSRGSHAEGRLAPITDKAVARGFKTDVRFIEDGDAWLDVDRVGGVFGEDVVGVISLRLFSHPGYDQLPDDRLPFVCLGGGSLDCLPAVGCDTYAAYRLLTERLTALGHRNIICRCGPFDSEESRDTRLRGHAAAMAAAGLEVNTTAIERSRLVDPADLSGVRDFLREFDDATAIAAVGSNLGHDIAAVATMMGRRIPEDLSIVGSATKIHTTSPPTLFTRFDYNQTASLDACFKLLEEQIETRCCQVSHLLVRPIIVDGETIAPPRD